MVETTNTLSERYQIIRPIGSGGMANVYLARDLILNRDVAVKILRYDFQEDKDAIRRFQREAMSASQLLHHNIVEVYDVNEEDNQQYIVMEYVDGTDLKNYIHDNSPISLELSVNIMSQILSGINVAHRHGIIHRDIKPQNILITKDNEVKITDFGIAIALTDTSITQTNTLLGSVHYLSPEQARGNSATTKSDIYALGVVLYELITGEVPFNGESAVSVALKHFQETFPRIRTKLDYVPQSLENVVLKATAKDPNDRYNTVQDMLHDLQSSLSASRMNEQMFKPASESQETMILQPIRPKQTNNQRGLTGEQNIVPPEPLDEDIYPTYDTIQPVAKPRRNYRLIRVGIVLFIAVILGLGLFGLYQAFVQNTSIPNLEGKTEAEAAEILQQNDLQVGEIKPSWSDEVATGLVIETEPNQGESIRRGSAVDLIVSRGKQQVIVDNYVGQPYESVRSVLINANFIVQRRDMWTDDSSLNGVILAQSIDPGSQVVPSETSITLTVGFTANSASMQDFNNLDLQMVHNFAESYGLYVTEEYAYDDYISEGRVISQSPSPGTPLTPGDTISVVVSQGPEEQQYSTQIIDAHIEYVPRYAPSDPNQDKPLPNQIQIFIGDANNSITDVAEEFEITESVNRPIRLSIPINGVGQYRILRDGEVIAESNQVYPE